MNLLASAPNRKAFVEELKELLARYGQQLYRDDGMWLFRDDMSDTYNFTVFMGPQLGEKKLNQADCSFLEPA